MLFTSPGYLSIDTIFFYSQKRDGGGKSQQQFDRVVLRPGWNLPFMKNGRKKYLPEKLQFDANMVPRKPWESPEKFMTNP